LVATATTRLGTEGSTSNPRRWAPSGRARKHAPPGRQPVVRTNAHGAAAWSSTASSKSKATASLRAWRTGVLLATTGRGPGVRPAWGRTPTAGRPRRPRRAMMRWTTSRDARWQHRPRKPRRRGGENSVRRPRHTRSGRDVRARARRQPRGGRHVGLRVRVGPQTTSRRGRFAVGEPSRPRGGESRSAAGVCGQASIRGNATPRSSCRPVAAFSTNASPTMGWRSQASYNRCPCRVVMHCSRHRFDGSWDYG